jgi:tRNA-2-methylthio-N6-dimethylallyladenosine synthase
MKRNYTTLEYKSIIRKLKKVCPEITLSSDFIIGFPNETLEEYNQTKKILQEINFDYSFSFLYSPRPGTPASFIKDEISKEIKESRLKEFQEINNNQGKEYTKQMMGTKQRVLFDSLSTKQKGYMKGKTDNNRVVEIEYDKNLFNELVEVQIKGFIGKNLLGIPINEN